MAWLNYIIVVSNILIKHAYDIYTYHWHILLYRLSIGYHIVSPAPVWDWILGPQIRMWSVRVLEQLTQPTSTSTNFSSAFSGTEEMGIKHEFNNFCRGCHLNSLHIESSNILQPPKYLFLFVNRFRYLDNDIIKDRCPLHLDTTVMLGPLKFNLQATIDHHGPSIDSGHYTASINCCKKKHSIATITKLRSLELLIKTPLLHILYYINGLTHDFWTRTGGWEFDRSHGAGTSSSSHWQQVEEQAPKPVDWTMCFLLMTLVPVQKLCVNIYVYIYMCTFLIRVLL